LARRLQYIDVGGLPVGLGKVWATSTGALSGPLGSQRCSPKPLWRA